MNFQEVISFWFEETDPSLHFKKSDAFDRLVRERFGATRERAAACEFYEWRREPLGRLAEIIVLDQFSRNIFRDSPEAFAADSLALALAQEAIALGTLGALKTGMRSFLCMPFMHSESARIHVEAEKLFKSLGDEGSYEFELKHKAIVDRFGRYPHRNAILGRDSTPEEIAFLETPGSSF